MDNYDLIKSTQETPDIWRPKMQIKKSAEVLQVFWKNFPEEDI